MDATLSHIKQAIEALPETEVFGKVSAVKGLLLECQGLEKWVSIGTRCRIVTRKGHEIYAEVVGFRENTSLLMPFKELDGVGVGCPVFVAEDESVIFPDESWKGRVLNALGEPIDEKGPLGQGKQPYPLRNSPPSAHARHRVTEKIDLGVRSINTFITCCRGQRMGIFAGSGVGKSMLVSMLTKHCQADIKIIGLIGERGREVQEFLHEYLGEEGLKNAIVIVATGDESALMRRQAAWLTMAVAEYFRDKGQDVLCLMDSITRFAMAQREIGLSAGEPPTTKGYPPTVFSELPKLLERAGPGTNQGNITGLFSVLVEGDDHNEPISDAVRGILDGHIVLSRQIAERGRFPSVDVLKSVSRTLPGCNNDYQNQLTKRARQLMNTYSNMAELIRLGAYKRGSDPEVDEAIIYHDALERFLAQVPDEKSTLEECYAGLGAILGMADPNAPAIEQSEPAPTQIPQAGN